MLSDQIDRHELGAAVVRLANHQREIERWLNGDRGGVLMTHEEASDLIDSIRVVLDVLDVVDVSIESQSGVANED